MNEIWNIIEPYILTICGTLCGGSIIALLASFVCKRIIAKASSAYDLNAFASKVADKLGGKTFNVDITALVEDKLKEICKILYEKVDDVADETNSYKFLLARMGEALTHLKMLTDEERAELVKAVKELDSEYDPPKKEVIATVKLEPIAIVDETPPVKSDTVNFG